jgi:hypothetical protein
MKVKAIERLRFIGVPIKEITKEGVEVKPDAAKVSISLGGWSSVVDNAKYFPNVTAKDCIPKPEDFLLIPFRFISATLVGAESYRATRFPADVLKAAMPLLEGRPVYTDHDTSTSTNIIGHVESVYWQEEYFDEKAGLTIPAGINGNFAINCKIAPHVASNLYTGALDSNSVTVEFYWEPSHKMLSPDDNFSYKIGEYDENGKPYCRVVTEILKFPETSPVTRGADPFARTLGRDGKIIAPDTAMLSLSETELVKVLNKDSHSIICKSDVNVLRLSLSDKGYQQSNSDGNTEIKKVKMNDKLLLFAVTLLGLTADTTELTDAQQDLFIAKLSEQREEKPNVEREALTSLLTRSELSVGADVTPYKLAKVEELTALNASVTNLRGELEAAKTENERLKPLAATGETVIVSLRAEAERLHTAVMKGAPNAAILSLIKTADKEALEGLVKSFGGELTGGEFQATCTKCGNADNVSFQSSVPSEDLGIGGQGAVEVDTRTVAQRVADREANRDIQI